MQNKASTSSGLARLRPLTEGKNEIQNTSSKNLPSGWFYNESVEQNVWSDLEKVKDIDTSLTLENENKKTENKSQMNESSAKITQIIDRFDEIDQSFIMEVQQLFDIDGNTENSNEVDDFIANEKLSVIQFIEELNTYSENQVNMLNSLKSSFQAIQTTSSFLNDEAKDQINSLNAKGVLEDLENFLACNIDKCEKAVMLHNDVTRFWVNHLSSLKKVISVKDAEIDKKKEEIKTIKAELQDKKNKAKAKAKEDSEKSMASKQLDQCIRTIETQKSQIADLRQQLRECEFQKAASSQLGRNMSMTSFEKEEILAKENEFQNKLLEAETKVMTLTGRLAEMEKDLKKSNNSYEEQKGFTILANNKLNNANSIIKEKDLEIQKYIKLLEIERNKPEEVKPEEPAVDPRDDEIEEHLATIMKLKLQIKEMKEQSKKELNEQADIIRQKYMRQKQDLLNQMENSKDNSRLLQSIIDEYEKKIKEMETKHNEEIQETLRNWGSKLSIQQRQFQNRIRILNQNHEAEIITVTNSINYKNSKLKVELENSYQQSLLEKTRKFEEEMRTIQKESNKIKSLNNDLNLQIKNLKAQYGIIDEDEEKPPEVICQQNNMIITEQRKMLEQYKAKINIIKEELKQQNQWALEEQKNYYENKIQNLANDDQKDIRNMLLKVQESVSRMQNEGEKALTIQEALDSIANTVITLNDKCTEERSESDETVSLAESNKRMELLTEEVSRLKAERDELLSKDGVEDLMKELESLRARIKFYENLQNGDKNNVANAMKDLEDELRQEIAVKDALISHYKEERKMRSTFIGNLRNDIIFDKEGKASNEPVERIVIKEVYVNKPVEKETKEEAPGDEYELNIAEEPHEDELETEETPIEETNEFDVEDVEENHEEEVKETKEVVVEENHEKEVKETPIEEPPKEEKKEPIVEEPPKEEKKETIVEETPKEEKKEVVAPTPKVIKLKMQKLVSFHRPIKLPAVPKEKPVHIEISPVINEHEVKLQTARSNVSNTSEKKKEEPRKEVLPELTINISAEIDKDTSRSAEVKQIPVNPDQHYRDTVKTKVSYSISIERKEPLLIEKTQHFSIITDELFTYNKNDDNFRKAEILYIKDPVFMDKEEEDGKEKEFDFSKLSKPQPNSSRVNTKKPRTLPKPRVKLALSGVTSFSPTQRFVTMTQTVAPIIVRYKGQRDMVHFPEFFIERNDVELKIEDSYILNDIFEVRMQDIMDQTKDNRSLEYQKLKSKLIGEIEQKDVLIANQKIKIDDLNSQLIKLQAAYRLARKSEDKLRLLRERTESTIKLIERSKTTEQISEVAVEKKEVDKEKTDKKSSRKEKLEQIEDEVDEVEDPFTKAIQLMAANIRFMNEYKNNEEEMGQTLRNDYISFESFLIATGQMNDSESSFISQVKKATKSVDSNMDRLNDYEILQHQLLSVLRQSKKKVQSMKDESFKLAKSILSKEIEGQQKSLQNSIEIGHAKSSRLNVMEKIRTALETVKKLPIKLSDDDCSSYEKLMKRCNYMEKKIQDDNDITEEEIEKLKIEVQNLIAGLKPAEEKSVIEPTDNGDLNELRERVSKLEQQNSLINKELNQERDNSASQKQQIASYQHRLKESKESYTTTIEMYRSQITALKDLLKNSESGVINNGPMDTVSAVKSEIIKLHTVSESLRIENENKQNKIEELHDQIIEKDKILQNSQKMYSDMLHAKDELEKLIRKQDEQALFHESDIQKLELEREQNEQSGMKSRIQLEEALGVIDKLNGQIKTMAQTNSDQKKEIANMKNEIEDLQIKLSFGHYNRTKIPHTTLGTQTTFTLIVHHRSSKRAEKAEAKQQQQQQETQKNEEPTENREPAIVTTESTEKPTNVANTESVPIKISDNVPNIIETPKMSVTGSPIDSSEERIQLSSINNSTSSLFQSTEQWIDVQNDEEKDIFTEELQSATNNDALDYKLFGDQAVNEVHAPLAIKKPKTKISPYLVEPKNLKAKMRPSTSIQKTVHTADTSKLYIGDSPQAYKATGMQQRYRQRPRKLTHLPSTTAPKLEIIQNSMHFAPISVPVSPKRNEHSTNVLPNGVPQTPIGRFQAPDATIDDNETVRITSFQYEGAKTELNSPRLPIVIPIPRQTWSEKKQPRNADTEKGDISEIELIIAKLREKNSRQQDEIDKKDQTIDDLNEKVGDLTRDLQRAKLDAIKSDDASRKISIKFENIRSRLDIAMQELDIRNEEVNRMRDEMEKLKRATEPATKTLNRLKNAQQEQRRISSEQLRKKQMIDNAKTAMLETKDEKAYKHLEQMMKNTQNSLARLEATKRLWKDIETKQIMGALGAMSLIDEPPSQVLQNLRLPAIRSRVRQAKKEFYNIDSRPSNYYYSSTEAARNSPQLPITIDKTIEAIGDMGDDLTADEKYNALHGEIPDKVVKKILESSKKPNLKGTVLVGSPKKSPVKM